METKEKQERQTKKISGKIKEAGKISKTSQIRVVFISMLLAASVLSGCGKTDTVVEEPEVESITTPQRGIEEENNGTKQPAGGSENDSEQNADDQQDVNSETEDTQESDKLIGSVKSIGDNNIIISRVFEVAPDILAVPEDGSPDEELVTILLSDITTYEVHTVKNGGVNGDADVEKREGSFSDCKENMTIDAYGSYEGDVFHAVRIILYYFV